MSVFDPIRDFVFKNTFDGKKAWEAIDSNSTMVSERIYERYQSAPIDKPLVVPYGEDHSMPSHIICELMTIKKLKRKGIEFGVGLEYPSNLVQLRCSDLIKESLLSTGRGNENPNSVISQILAGAPYTHDILYHAATDSGTPFAPVSAATLAHNLKLEKIPIAFVDAARRSDGEFDWDDADTRSALFATLIDKGYSPQECPIDPASPLGIAARNKHMVDATMRFLDYIKPARLVIVIVGAAHVLGYVPPKMDFLSRVKRTIRGSRRARSSSSTAAW